MDEELAVEDLPVWSPIQDEQDFDGRLRKLAILTKTIDSESSLLISLKAEADALSSQLAKYMLSSGCSAKTLDGVKFTQKQRIFSKVEDKDALRNWIIENDAVDLLMTVHPSKLTAYCNEQLEQNGTIPVGVDPNFIKYFVHVKG